MTKTIINTTDAPQAIGTYSQAVKVDNFPTVNEIMAQYFDEPYPARAAIGVSALPKGVGVEMDAVLVIA
jgi:enamine deaminase RidA (YjgF/YER057c/UK114 family)